MKFGPTDGRWSMRFFMQNLTNNDAITGAYDVGQGSGNFRTCSSLSRAVGASAST
ncbi:MAG: hypothetical protein R3C60_14540 [Parvularculaceae bacterium]